MVAASTQPSSGGRRGAWKGDMRPAAGGVAKACRTGAPRGHPRIVEVTSFSGRKRPETAGIIRYHYALQSSRSACSTWVAAKRAGGDAVSTVAASGAGVQTWPVRGECAGSCGIPCAASQACNSNPAAAGEGRELTVVFTVFSSVGNWFLRLGYCHRQVFFCPVRRIWRRTFAQSLIKGSRRSGVQACAGKWIAAGAPGLDASVVRGAPGLCRRGPLSPGEP